MNARTLSLALLPLFLLGSGCDLLGKKKKDDDSAEAESKGEKKKKKKGDDAAEGDKGAEGKGASTDCALPEGGAITSQVTLPKGCSLTVKGRLVVEGGGVLTLEAGAKLAFGANEMLEVRDGKLVAAGTEKEPVVFTSANATKAAGDWAGIYFGDAVSAGTELVNARVEYAGAEAQGGQGAITIAGQTAPKRIGIAGTTFENNARAAIVVDNDKGKFAKFERNVLKSNTLSVSAPAAVLGSIGAGNTFGDPLQTFGEVRESASWVAFGAPVLVRDNLRIGSDGAAPTLTLASGTVLKFAAGTYLSVGEDKGGGLVAPKATFTSANSPAHEGDWSGLFLYRNTTNVDLEGATIEHAGSEANGSRAAITFYDVEAKNARGVKLTGLTVRSSKQAALASTDNDCAPFASQVTASGVPVCRAE